MASGHDHSIKKIETWNPRQINGEEQNNKLKIEK